MEVDEAGLLESGFLRPARLFTQVHTTQSEISPCRRFLNSLNCAGSATLPVWRWVIALLVLFLIFQTLERTLWYLGLGVGDRDGSSPVGLILICRPPDPLGSLVSGSVDDQDLAPRRFAGLERLPLLLCIAIVPPRFMMNVDAFSWGLGNASTLVSYEPGFACSGYTRGSVLDYGSSWWVWVFAGCLLPAITEEICFRGALGPLLVARCGLVRGVLLTSFLFALIHINNPAAARNAFFGGLLSHVAFLATKTILAPILLHFGWNLAVTTLRQLIVEKTFIPLDLNGYLPTDKSMTVFFTATVTLMAFLYALIRQEKTQAAIRQPHL